MYCAICGLWLSHHDPGIVSCAGGVLCCACMCVVGCASGVCDTKAPLLLLLPLSAPAVSIATEHQLYVTNSLYYSRKQNISNLC